jgi:hypothetical protein
LVGILAASATAAGVLALGAAPAHAVSGPEAVATGLDNPFKLSFGPDGDLYVAEAGRGGATCFDPPPRPDGDAPERCFGSTGAVSKVVDGLGAQSRVLTGLPSWTAPGEATGPSDVAVAADGTLYVSVGLGGNVHSREDLYGEESRFGTVIVADDEGEVSVLADLAQLEADVDPDQGEAVGAGGDSNPYALELLADGSLLAVDAGGNSLLRITDAGVATVEEVFPPGETDAPPSLGLPPGAKVPYQFVPTAVEVVGGATLVSQLTGFPFPVGASSVYDVSGNGLTSVAGGFTNVVDLAVDADGNVYVAELAHSGLLSRPPDPRIVQVRPDGDRKVLLNSADLQGAPTGITIGPDGLLYVSLGLAGPGEGRVVRFDPRVATDGPAADACPPPLVPGTTFADIALSVHREAIECLVWWDAVEGVSAEAFAPGRATTRGQLASVLARAMQTAGVALPPSPVDAFPDDAGSPHEAAINRLVARDVIEGFADGTFRPNVVVNRGQLASLLVRAHDHLFEVLPEGPRAFDDDDGNVHEANIDVAAGMGWVRGTGPRTFQPGAPTTRAQMATVLARMLADLVANGHADLPATVG